MAERSTIAHQKSNLRRATFADHRQIALLQSRYGMGFDTEEEWQHLWKGNPLYRELQEDWEIGWVIEDQCGRIVGSLSNVPLPYEFAGKRIIAASGRALVVEPEHRAAAPVLLDNWIRQPGVDLLLNTTVSPEAMPVFAPFEFPRVPVGAWDQAAFWITTPCAFFERILHAKLPALAKALSYPLAAGDLLRDRLTERNWRKAGVPVAACPRFDERFDAFWEELESRHSNLLIGVRTSAVLNWHFRRALLGSRLWIATIGEGTRLAAYAIFERKDNPRFGLSRMRLVDCQSLESGSDYLLALLAWAFQKCRQEGIHMLEIVGRWLHKGELAGAAAPYRRRLANWMYFYRANREDLADRLRDPSSWDPSLYDGDASL
jgi:hypothetical protein